MLCMAGFLLNPVVSYSLLSLCVSVCVSVLKISKKNIEPINFIFGGGLTSDPFDFEKKIAPG